MAEARIGARDEVGEFRIGEGVADEGPHDAEGDLFIAEPRQRAMSPALICGMVGGHIEPAVAGKARSASPLRSQHRGLPRVEM
jgi:hypothetical protein